MIELTLDSLVIRNTAIWSFLGQHKHLLQTVEQVLCTWCESVEKTTQGEAVTVQSLASHFENMKTDMLNEVRQQAHPFASVVGQLADLISSTKQTLADLSPAAIAESMAHKLPVHLDTTSAAFRGILHEAVCGAVSPLADRTSGCNALLSTISQRLDQVREAQINTSAKSKKKGDAAESKIYEELVELLPDMDVQKVSGMAHCCDINVCDCGTDVRVEVKDYTSRVDKAEVSKFITDMLSCNSHGIMVSTQTGITGKRRSIEFQQLSNGKFAVFLSNGNADTVSSMVTLLKLVDKQLLPSGDDDAVFKLTPETMMHLQQLLKEHDKKMKDARHHLKQVDKLLAEAAIEKIASILLGHAVSTAPLRCTHCTQEFKTERGLLAHTRVKHLGN